MDFTLDEIERYQRQVILPEWGGGAGQARLRAASVAVFGRGAAAELCTRYLAAMGVGHLAVEAFADEARAINPIVAVRAIPSRPLPPPREPRPDPPAALDFAHPGAPAGATAVAIEGGARLVAADDRAATGAALAVETVKALLGLPHRERVALSIGRAGEPPA